MSAEPLSPEEIEAIRERDAKRTPGKWLRRASLGIDSTVESEQMDGNIPAAIIEVMGDRARSDAVFIAGMSEDAPRLLATIDARTGVVGTAEAWGAALADHRWQAATTHLDKLYGLLGHGSMMTRAEFESGELAKLRSENARLREEIARLLEGMRERAARRLEEIADQEAGDDPWEAVALKGVASEIRALPLRDEGPESMTLAAPRRTGYAPGMDAPPSPVPVETLIAQLRAALGTAWIVASKEAPSQKQLFELGLAVADARDALNRIAVMLLGHGADETGSTPPDPGATQGV